MNSPYHLPSGISHEEAVLVFLGVIVFAIVLTGAALRQATQIVAGFTPSWGRAFCALVFSAVLSFVVNIVLALAFRVKPDHPAPLIFFWMLVFGLLSHAVAFKTFLKGSDTTGLSLLQAIMVNLMQAVLMVAAFLAIGVVIFAGALLLGGSHPSVPTIASSQASPAPAATLPAPTFASVADAQKEAVRRYPQLGVSGSQMNKAFVERYRLYQKTKPDFLTTKSWPIQIAEEIANNPSPR